MAESRRNQAPLMGKKNVTRIFLWRHPEVVGHDSGRVWGHSDVALTKRGKEQLQLIVKRMSREKLTAVYSSDLQRARLVAEAVARAQKPRKRVTLDSAFRELCLGCWEGLSLSDIQHKYPGALEERQADLENFRMEGGESVADLAGRVMPAFQEMVGTHFGGSICLIAHGGVNRLVLNRILGAPLKRLFRIQQDYACLNEINVYEDGVPVIFSVNQQVSDEQPFPWEEIK